MLTITVSYSEFFLLSFYLLCLPFKCPFAALSVQLCFINDLHPLDLGPLVLRTGHVNPTSASFCTPVVPPFGATWQCHTNVPLMASHLLSPIYIPCLSQTKAKKDDLSEVSRLGCLASAVNLTQARIT